MLKSSRTPPRQDNRDVDSWLQYVRDDIESMVRYIQRLERRIQELERRD